MNELIVALGVLSILCQFAAAYFGYKIYKCNRLGKWWLALVIAFVIQGVRRLLTTFDDYSALGFSGDQVIDRLFQFSISLLILIGLWCMLKNFQRFEVVEKQSKEKVASFKNCECHLKNKKRKR